MHQQQPTRDLQLDSDQTIAQQPRLNPIIHEQRTNIIKSNGPAMQVASRVPLPIATVEQYGNRTFIPAFGVDILNDIPSIQIEQTCELHEGLNGSSENRYTLRSPLGDALFAATESSTERDRTIWGPGRPFQMHLLDKTHQEAFSFHRKLAFGVLCCQPRTLEVWAPPGDFLGKIIESSAFYTSKFDIQTETGEVLFTIEGPSTMRCCMPKETFFNIYSPDGQTICGMIRKKWSIAVNQYVLIVSFNNPAMNVRSKALFIGAAFLLEYMYFQSRF